MAKIAEKINVTQLVRIPSSRSIGLRRVNVWVPIATGVAAASGIGLAQAYHALMERRRQREEEALLPFPVRRG